MPSNTKEYRVKYAKLNVEKQREHQRKYSKTSNSKKLYKIRQERYRRNLKLKCFASYGGKCCCCGETEEYFLTIDHIYGGGTKHRNELKKTNDKFYAWLKRNNFPPGYQVLCLNCNRGKWLNGGICPHKKKIKSSQ